jgi:putative PIN family toxin of toxin-antitoxin system
MRVVLDTNVLVAGLLKPFGPCGRIVRLVVAGELTPCFDARILGEYEEVLRRPCFEIDPRELEVVLHYIRSAGEPQASRPLPSKLPDPDDAPFLEAAIAAEADCLITGNAKHFPPRCRLGVRVLSPAQFLEFHRTRCP